MLLMELLTSISETRTVNCWELRSHVYYNAERQERPFMSSTPGVDIVIAEDSRIQAKILERQTGAVEGGSEYVPGGVDWR